MDLRNPRRRVPMRRRQAVTFQGRTPLISHPPIPPPPPPPFESVWTPATVNPWSGGRALYGVWMPARERFVVVGYARSGGLPIGDFIAVSDDRGETWDLRHVDGWDFGWPGNLAIGYSPSQDRIVITGDQSTSTETHSAYSDDGGDTWIHNPISLVGTFPTWYPYSAFIASVKWIEAQSQWVFGGPNMATSPTGIDDFTKRYFFNDGGYVSSIAHIPSLDRIFANHTGKMLTSDDAGATWTVRTTPFDSGQIAIVEWMPSVGQIWGGGNDNNSVVTRSVMFTEDGITWWTAEDEEHDPGYMGGTSVAQVFCAADTGPELLVGPFNFGFDGTDHSGFNIKGSIDDGFNWSPEPNLGGNILSFVVGDTRVLALGGIYGGPPIMWKDIIS